MRLAGSTTRTVNITVLTIGRRLSHSRVRHLRADHPVAELRIALAELAADPLAFAREDAVTVAVGDLDLVIAVALVQSPTSGVVEAGGH